MKKFLGQYLLVSVAIFTLLISTAQAGYQIRKGRIFNDATQAVQLRGVNWFGFETPDHVVHGLWAREWKSMITQMKSLGFNAVRLPFCPATVQGSSVATVNYSLNPDLQNKNSLEVLDLVVNRFNSEQMHVLLDHHRPDCNAISELWYTGSYSETQWISDLTFVANRYKNLPYFLGLDLKNEPHGSATWGTGNNATDWNRAAERAAAQILANAPNILIFVEGVGENPVCSDGTFGHFWGENIQPLACAPLSIPANRLVLSPHVYGPDVFDMLYFQVQNFPANMPAIWNQHFGRFQNDGYALVIGEFGGKFGHGGNPRDVTWQNAFVDYLTGKNIRDSFYWSWNPNSGDTGGILKDDWTNVWQDKVDLLNRLWKVAPGAGRDSIYGRVTTNPGRGISGARVTMTDLSGNARYATTNQSGVHHFTDAATGTTYTLAAARKRFRFDAARSLNISEETNNLNFIARP